MATVVITDVEVKKNPATFDQPFKFIITFDCRAPGIAEELEWKLIYVGSASDEKLDQELDSVLVGPVAVGKSKFKFKAPAPNPALIPKQDLLEVTVLLLTCSYREQEFIRIGYYVNNDFGDNQALAENPPDDLHAHVGHIRRTILADRPRVTRFQINWTGVAEEHPAAAMGELQMPNQGEEDVDDVLMEDDDEGDEDVSDDDEDDVEEFDLEKEELEERKKHQAMMGQQEMMGQQPMTSEMEDL